jgi:hypothetical protein
MNGKEADMAASAPISARGQVRAIAPKLVATESAIVPVEPEIEAVVGANVPP